MDKSKADLEGSEFVEAKVKHYVQEYGVLFEAYNGRDQSTQRREVNELDGFAVTIMQTQTVSNCSHNHVAALRLRSAVHDAQ